MKAVVGAAVVRYGCVLAARRTSPPAAAGHWEFPGGKVEDGEAPDEAIVREIAEELGCTVEITGWLDGTSGIGSTHQLTIALARIVDGEPTPTVHDALRWLPPEELLDLEWLEPDLPFLSQLSEHLLDGEPLEGGNVGGAVRIGETVRRPVGPWTQAVHRLLAHLRAAGLDGVPAPHGRDPRGREVLDFLPGQVVDVDDELLSDGRLASLARWTARLHEAVADFEDPGPWRFFGADDPDLVAHNDLAPYNVCFDHDDVAGVFDWDLAGPSTRLMELAHLAWNGVPLFREIPAAEAARRLEIVADAYGGPSAAEILVAVPPRVQVAIHGIRRAAAAGDEGMRNLRATGEPGRIERRLADLVGRMPEILGILEP